MRKNLLVITLVLALLQVVVTTAFSAKQVLNITLIEYFSERVAFNGTHEKSEGISWSGEVLWPLTIKGKFVLENIYEGVVSSINVTLENTSKINWSSFTCSYPSYSTVNIECVGTGGVCSNITLYITELKPGDNVTCTYDINSSEIVEPIDINEEYNKTKAIVGKPLRITINVTNNLDVPIESLQVTKEPGCYENITGGVSCWNFTELLEDDNGNANLVSTENGYSKVEWSVNGSYLSPHESARIVLVAYPPENLNVNWSEDNWGVWLNAGNISVTFETSEAFSGVKVSKVEGIPLNSTVLEVKKKRVNETWWSIEASVAEVKNVSMLIREVRLWAVNRSDVLSNPDNMDESNAISGSLCVNNTEFAIENTSTLVCNSTFEWPYVIVAYGTIADLTVNDIPSQIIRSNKATVDSEEGYGYVEDVYVVNSYFVRVAKYVNETSENNVYNITVILENIGNQPTPQKIYVYDLIPVNFTNATPITVSGVSAGNYKIFVRSITSGNYQGYKLIEIEINERLLPNQKVIITYKVNGSGLYDLKKVYIVGVDPLRVEGVASVINEFTAIQRMLLEGDIIYVAIMGIIVVSSLIYVSRK